MYEARRQRSSWARIKLSIVRKFMSITYLRLANKLLDFILIVVLSLFFELTSFLIKVTLILVFSYSVFNVQLRVVDIPWFETAISNQVLLRLLFIFAFNFGFVFVLSLVNTLLCFHHWGLHCFPLRLILNLGSRPSAHSAVSSPTNSILTRQFLLSTSFFYYFLQFVTL